MFFAILFLKLRDLLFHAHFCNVHTARVSEFWTCHSDHCCYADTVYSKLFYGTVGLCSGLPRPLALTQKGDATEASCFHSRGPCAVCQVCSWLHCITLSMRVRLVFMYFSSSSVQKKGSSFHWWAEPFLLGPKAPVIFPFSGCQMTDVHFHSDIGVIEDRLFRGSLPHASHIAASLIVPRCHRFISMAITLWRIWYSNEGGKANV